MQRTVRSLLWLVLFGVLPDSVVGDKENADRMLPPFDGTPSAWSWDRAMSVIADRFGRSTAYGVALDFDYPGSQRRAK